MTAPITPTRVAAYARVSLSTTQTLHSAAAQTEHYTQLIQANPAWEFAGIYTDFGISGTQIKKRPGFQRMMAECEAGRIDLILVKSISRFARNTIELLKSVRRLKELGISVYFEEQHIDSLTAEGELMLTLAASIAQAESESISENVKWVIRKNFQQGKANTRRRTFGYRWENKKMEIIPEEAAAVRKIFADFFQGKSRARTADELNSQGIRTVLGNPMSASSVSFILQNITYTGCILLQKTYIQDPITKKKRKNHGQLPRYLVPDHHPAIISMDTFEQVQAQLARNRQLGRFPYNHTNLRYPFSGKITCGCCGRHYTRQLWKNQGKERPTWVCTGKKSYGRQACSSQNIMENKLLEICARVLGKPEFDPVLFEKKISGIKVEGRNFLVFSLTDGRFVKIMWRK